MSPRTNNLGVFEQFTDPLQNKIGIILRPSENEIKKCLFKSIKYKPLYLPNNLSMNVCIEQNKNEPKYIYMDFAKEKINKITKKQKIYDQEINQITGFNIFIKTQQLPESSLIIMKNSNINIYCSKDNFIEIIFDNEANKFKIDLMPDMPLVIKY